VQFSCESCKTQLQIADEKVRGKRLVVRCRRCGAKITIADPALAGKLTRPVQPGAAQPNVPAGLAPKPAAPQPAAAAQPAPTPQPAAKVEQVAPATTASPAPAPKRSSDTDSTQAMDSELLERALKASKAERPDEVLRPAPAAAPAPAPAPAAAPAPAPAAAPAPAPVADTALWFAMLQGKQAGPLTRADLVARADSGELGARTYVWREGMDAWQRARDVSDLAFLFSGGSEPPAPAPPPVREEPAPPPEEPAKPSDEQVLEDGVPDELFSAGASAGQSGWANESAGESGPGVAGPRAASPEEPTPAPRSRATPMFESSAPPRSRTPFALVMVVLAAAAVGAWLFLERKASTSQPASAVIPDASVAAPDAAVGEAEPSPPDAQVAAAPAASPTPAPAEPAAAPAAGLTPDQVRTKLDENKGALQGCIDEALKKEPNLRVGRIHIATTIAPSGQVTAARIDKRSVDDAPLGACLKKATRKMVFPSFGGQPFDVDIPIVVTAGE
jgi:predicted Zn finger-like uncharacterized protein